VIKKIFFLILFLTAGLNLFAQVQKDLPPIPNPARFVNDFAGVLNQSDKQALESKLKAYYDSTSSQLTIILVHSIGQYDIAEYTTQTGKYWKIGQQGKNNGALLLIAVDDHKYFTATGYGMEGVLPDATVKIIEQRHLVPNLKAKKYYEAIDETTTALIQAAAGEYKADPNQNAQQGEGGMSLGLLIPIILIGLLFIFRLFRNRGGRGGGIMSAIPFLLFNGGGSSGGSNFGGGGGGGGFNFGGGDFGGGGAGGSW